MSTELQSIIGSIIQQLANWTGQTVETIGSNLPSFLKAYGWYYTLHDIHWDIIQSLIFSGIAAIILGAIVFSVMVDFSNDEIMMKTIKTYAKFALIVMIGLTILSVLVPIITTFVCPEIVGTKALIDLIKTIS